METGYVSGSNLKAEAILRKVARDHGLTVQFTSCGNLACYKRRAYKGVIYVIPSHFDIGAPSPIGSKGVHREYLEDVRADMNNALMDAGVLSGCHADV